MFRKKLFRTLLPLCLFVVICGVHSQGGPADTSWHTFDAPDTSGSENISEAAIIPAAYLKTQSFINTYIRKNSHGLARLRKRSAKYFTVIEPVLKRYEIPDELKYLAVVESGFNTTLVSNRGAGGIWQLMPVTARQLGLAVNEETDERFHVQKSTVASAKYLKRLYKEFGDWLLVVAAYNSGPGHVSRAIRKTGSRDFWDIQHLLPAQTRNHVKKFISIQYYFESGS